MNNQEHILIKESSDVIRARQMGRKMTKDIGFGSADQTRLATAISELTRNIIEYAGEGICDLQIISDQNNIGLKVTVEDKGPGITDIESAMKDGYTTRGGLGAGLPGTKRLVTSFDLQSEPGHTKITIELMRRKII